jgi:hypothetical protein
MVMWILKNITEEQYREIYDGTSAMGIIDLFKSEPESDDDAFVNYYPSKLWRMNSGVYKIEDKEGDLIPFEMNWAQHVVYSYYLRHPRMLILKSRQQGISTYWLLFFFDSILVEDNMKFGLMAQGLKEAKTLKERVQRAWKHLPGGLVEFLGIKTEKVNTDEFSLSNDSKIYIATSFRSGTLQGLHISEFGKISAKTPEKAKETKTGSMQTIRGGLPVIIESTAEGRHNMFYDEWMKAISHTGNLSPKDFQPVFLSWVDDPDCRIEVPQVVDREAEDYFKDLVVEYELYFKRPLLLSDEQKWWWVAQLREFNGSREMMGQEYPGFPEEAFAATKDGTYWAKLFRTEVVARGRVVPELYDSALPVDVAIDLGMNDMMVLVFFQTYANELRVIDEYHNSGEGIAHYVMKLKEKPYRYRSVYLPHDAVVKELGTGRSRYAIFREMGVPVRLLPRTKSVVNDIELVRKAIPYMYFDEKKTKYLMLGMENYTKEWDDRLGVFKDKPLHNEWSHPADAIRYMVMATYHKIKPKGSAISHGVVKKRKSTNVIDGLALI